PPIEARRRDGYLWPLRLGIDRILKRPEHVPRLRHEARDGVGMPDDELALAADGVNHRRRVTNFLRGQRAPNLFARLFVKGDDHAIRAAHQTNQTIAVEQRMRGPTPHWRLGVEARGEIHGPNQFAAARFEATQVTHRAECEHP